VFFEIVLVLCPSASHQSHQSHPDGVTFTFSRID
jgi:hypothetical protein